MEHNLCSQQISRFVATVATEHSTAFFSLDQLERAMIKGYVPTLSRKNPDQATLGMYLEQIGKRVFWTK